MKRYSILSMAAGLALVCGGTVHAQVQPPAAATPRPAIDGRVWGALVYATDSAEKLTGVKSEPAKLLPDLNDRLGKVFPWAHFEILGQHTQDVFRQYESWVVPTTDLFLKVDSKGRDANGGMHLHLQFWRQEQVLLKTDALLRRHSPLFIAGPKWRDGQLIFVLLLAEETAGQ